MIKTSCNLLGQDVAAQVGEYLQADLFDLIAIALQAKQAHWNVIGSNFRELHQQFDEVAEVARNAADEVAERLAAIGISPDGRGVSVVNDSSLTAMPRGFLGDRQAIEVVTLGLDQVCRSMRSKLEVLGQLDPVSQDVVIEALRGLEKQLWMLHARLQEPR